METLKGLLKISDNSKSQFEYELYKYEDIQSKWIIHQGDLQYLYKTTILGDSIFKHFYAVLTRIPFDNMKDMIGLYLYTDEKKSPSYFFSIYPKIEIDDLCKRAIKPIPKCFIFELKFIEKEKSEIFGAKNDFERKKWIEKIKNAFQKDEPSTLKPNRPCLPPVSVHEPKDFSPDPARFYRPFDPDYLPLNKVEDDINNNKQSSPTDDSKSSSYSIVDPERSNSISQEKTFLWNDIFYLNEKDDYISILAETGERGAFLIRPQSKKTSSNDHDYTLCLYYASNNIRCFGIHQLPTRGNEYSLSEKGLKSFVDMIQLCQYYTMNPLPMSVNNIYLKKPYKHYQKQTVYYIE